MPVSTSPLDFDHKPGLKCLRSIRKLSDSCTGLRKGQNYSSKNAISLEIRQLIESLYKTPERKQQNRKGKNKKISDVQIDAIIEYCSKTYENRYLDYKHLVLELKLDITASTLQRRMY